MLGPTLKRACARIGGGEVYVRRYLEVLALVATLGLVAAACGDDDGGATGATGAGGGDGHDR